MRAILVDILKHLSVYDPHLLIDGFEVFDAGEQEPPERVGVLRLGMGQTVNASLLPDSEASQAVVEGLRAHHRAQGSRSGRAFELVVMPRLHINRPIVLSTRVALTGLDAPVIRAAQLALSHG